MNTKSEIDRRTFLRLLSGALVTGAALPLVSGCGGGNGGVSPLLPSSSSSSASSSSMSSVSSASSASNSSSSSSSGSSSSTSTTSSSSSSSSRSSSSSSSSSANLGVTVTGIVVDSVSLLPLGGYTVALGSFSALSAANGGFSLPGVTISGSQTLNVLLGTNLMGTAIVTIGGYPGGTYSLGTIDVVSSLTPPPAPLKRKR